MDAIRVCVMVREGFARLLPVERLVSLKGYQISVDI